MDSQSDGSVSNKSAYKVRRGQKLIYSVVIRIERRIAADARNASNLFVTVGLIQVRHEGPVPTALLFKSYLPGVIFDHNNGIDKTVPSCEMHEHRFFLLFSLSPFASPCRVKSRTTNIAFLRRRCVNLPRGNARSPLSFSFEFRRRFCRPGTTNFASIRSFGARQIEGTTRAPVF